MISELEAATSRIPPLKNSWAATTPQTVGTEAAVNRGAMCHIPTHLASRLVVLLSDIESAFNSEPLLPAQHHQHQQQQHASGDDDSTASTGAAAHRSRPSHVFSLGYTHEAHEDTLGPADIPHEIENTGHGALVETAPTRAGRGGRRPSRSVGNLPSVDVFTAALKQRDAAPAAGPMDPRRSSAATGGRNRVTKRSLELPKGPRNASSHARREGTSAGGEPPGEDEPAMLVEERTPASPPPLAHAPHTRGEGATNMVDEASWREMLRSRAQMLRAELQSAVEGGPVDVGSLLSRTASATNNDGAPTPTRPTGLRATPARHRMSAQLADWQHHSTTPNSLAASRKPSEPFGVMPPPDVSDAAMTRAAALTSELSAASFYSEIALLLHHAVGSVAQAIGASHAVLFVPGYGATAGQQRLVPTAKDESADTAALRPNRMGPGYWYPAATGGPQATQKATNDLFAVAAWCAPESGAGGRPRGTPHAAPRFLPHDFVARGDCCSTAGMALRLNLLISCGNGVEPAGDEVRRLRAQAKADMASSLNKALPSTKRSQHQASIFVPVDFAPRRDHSLTFASATPAGPMGVLVLSSDARSVFAHEDEAVALDCVRGVVGPLLMRCWAHSVIGAGPGGNSGSPAGFGAPLGVNANSHRVAPRPDGAAQEPTALGLDFQRLRSAFEEEYRPVLLGSSTRTRFVINALPNPAASSHTRSDALATLALTDEAWAARPPSTPADGRCEGTPPRRQPQPARAFKDVLVARVGFVAAAQAPDPKRALHPNPSLPMPVGGDVYEPALAAEYLQARVFRTPEHVAVSEDTGALDLTVTLASLNVTQALSDTFLGHGHDQHNIVRFEHTLPSGLRHRRLAQLDTIGPHTSLVPLLDYVARLEHVVDETTAKLYSDHVVETAKREEFLRGVMVRASRAEVESRRLADRLDGIVRAGVSHTKPDTATSPQLQALTRGTPASSGESSPISPRLGGRASSGSNSSDRSRLSNPRTPQAPKALVAAPPSNSNSNPPPTSPSVVQRPALGFGSDIRQYRPQDGQALLQHIDDYLDGWQATPTQQHRLSIERLLDAGEADRHAHINTILDGAKHRPQDSDDG